MTDIDAQSIADEVFQALGVPSAPLIVQHTSGVFPTYTMYAHNFRYAGVACRLVVTVYPDKPTEISFCATGRDARQNGYDEMSSANTVAELILLVPDVIARASDESRQDFHTRFDGLR